MVSVPIGNISTILTAHARTYSNQTVLPEYKAQTTDLLPDGVHLYVEPGLRYFEYFVNCCLDLLDVEDDGELTMDTSQSASFNTAGSKTPTDSPTISDVMDLINNTVVPRLDEGKDAKKKVDIVEQTLLNRMNCDDILFARHSEELDQIRNERWTDRVVVVNLIDKECPSTLAEKKVYLAGKFRPLIESILGDIVYDIYPRPSNFDSSTIPPFEIKFPSEKDCRKFKMEAHKKVKEDATVWGDIGFHPKLTLASRVRVEILRAITRKVLSPTQSAYCPIYNPRPILHVGPLVEGKVKREETLTFVDAVLRFRHLLTINDLHFAYQRLGLGFHNVLRQMFIVLNDDDRKAFEASNPKPTQRSGPTKGVKRGHESTRGRGAPRGKRAK